MDPNLAENGLNGNGNHLQEAPPTRGRGRKDPTIDNATPAYDINKDTLWEACNWILGEAYKKHTIPPSRPKFCVSAAKSFMAILIEADEKIPTIAEFKDKSLLDGIAHRWINRTQLHSGTMDTYKQRVQWLIDEFTLRCEQMGNYKPAVRFAKYNNAHKERKPKTTARQDVSRPDDTESLPQSQPVSTAPAEASTPPSAPITGAVATPAAVAAPAAPPPTPMAKENTILVLLGPQQMAEIALPFPMVELNGGHIVRILGALIGQGITDFTPEHLTPILGLLTNGLKIEIKDVSRVVGRLASVATDYDFNRGLCDQLFPKS